MENRSNNGVLPQIMRWSQKNSAIILIVLATLWLIGPITSIFLTEVQKPVDQRIKGMETIGLDMYILLKAGQRVCNQQPLYPQGKWTDYSSTPYLNNRYHLIVAVLLRCIPEEQWVKIQVYGIWINVIAHLLSIVFFYLNLRVMSINVGFKYYAPLAIICSAVTGTMSYINIEPLVVCVGMILLWSMLTKQPVLSGLCLAFFAFTKIQWMSLALYWVIEVVVEVARNRHETDLRSALFRAMLRPITGVGTALILYIAVTYISVGIVGSEYGWSQVFDQYRFLHQSFDNMPYYYPATAENRAVTENGLLQLALRYLGPTPLAMYAFAFTAALIIVHFIVMTVYVIKHPPLENPLLAGFAYALLSWSTAMSLMHQLEYFSLVAIVYIFLVIQPRKGRTLALLLVPYIIFQFPALIYIFTKMPIFNWHEGPIVMFSLVVSLGLLSQYLRQLTATHSSLSKPTETSERSVAFAT